MHGSITALYLTGISSARKAITSVAYMVALPLTLTANNLTLTIEEVAVITRKSNGYNLNYLIFKKTNKQNEQKENIHIITD